MIFWLGKTILAKKLATTYGILLIDLKRVQDLAIYAAIIGAIFKIYLLI